MVRLKCGDIELPSDSEVNNLIFQLEKGNIEEFNKKVIREMENNFMKGLGEGGDEYRGHKSTNSIKPYKQYKCRDI